MRFRRPLLAALALVLTGCTPQAAPTAVESSMPPYSSPRSAMVAVVALAKDRHYTASYLWRQGERDRTVTVLLAEDGTWRVDVPGGALGGTVDVSVLWTAKGYFQCVLSGGPQRCVRIAAATGTVPDGSDPRIQHLFTDWLDVLLNRDAPLSIATDDAPDGVRGACFSVESNAVVLPAPISTGLYCFAEDGTLTAANVNFGKVRIVGDPLPATATATLPAPVSEGAPLGMGTPPKPKPKPSPGGSGRPRPERGGRHGPKTSPSR